MRPAALVLLAVVPAAVIGIALVVPDTPPTCTTRLQPAGKGLVPITDCTTPAPDPRPTVTTWTTTTVTPTVEVTITPTVWTTVTITPEPTR